MASIDRDELIRMMVGRHLSISARCANATRAQVVLSADNLTTQKVRDVSFKLRRGEVLGLAGLVGSGRSELGAALFGLDRIRQGTLS
ncbi:ATP-binding cassette domain-containing protein, partial [Acinetobacter baumannii]